MRAPASSIYGGPYAGRRAIALDSLARIIHRTPEQALDLAESRGWAIIYIDVPGLGQVTALDLSTVEPGIRQSIIQSAQAQGEPILTALDAAELQRAADQARATIHAHKVISIDAVRLAASRKQGIR